MDVKNHLWMVDECRDPEVWYLADEFCASLEMRLPHLVVLLLDFENLFACLLVQSVDFILNLVYPLYRILLIFVWQTQQHWAISLTRPSSTYHLCLNPYS